MAVIVSPKNQDPKSAKIGYTVRMASMNFESVVAKVTNVSEFGIYKFVIGNTFQKMRL